MATVKGKAPAKVNLTLHVTGQRADGYHLLDSLVVFSSVGDELTATTSPSLRLKVTGPFSIGVPTDGSNLILRAAETLRKRRGVTLGADIHVKKHLPHAAGIGGGSADAAAALRMLAALWKVDPLPSTDPEVLALGADVPVCLHAPAPVRMSGVGEQIQALGALPDCGIVLVRPDVAVPTAGVFDQLTDKSGLPMPDLPRGSRFKDLISWLGQQRNDLLAPARALAPQIDSALARLRAQPGVGYVGMSGSGATCFALVKDFAAARHVARIVQVAEMGWWVAPGKVLQPYSPLV